MGILPDQFYPMRTEDFELARIGFYRNREYYEDVIRRQVIITIAPWVKNLPSAEKIWPLPGDTERMSEQRKKNQEAQVALLNKHKKGGFEYRPGQRMIRGKMQDVIIEVPLN